MQWIYSIRPKYKAALILIVVFAMVLGNNILSKKNVADLGTSFTSVYEDRLLVESYIFQLSELLYRKKILIDKTADNKIITDTKQKLKTYNTEIDVLLASYEKTKLTATETVVFGKLRNNIAEMNTLENLHFGKENNNSAQTQAAFDNKFNAISQNLNKLSQIQVSEGKILNDESKKSIAGFTLLTQFETALLILLGLIIQALMFTSRSILPKSAQKHSLN